MCSVPLLFSVAKDRKHRTEAEIHAKLLSDEHIPFKVTAGHASHARSIFESLNENRRMHCKENRKVS